MRDLDFCFRPCKSRNHFWDGDGRHQFASPTAPLPERWRRAVQGGLGRCLRSGRLSHLLRQRLVVAIPVRAVILFHLRFTHLAFVLDGYVADMLLGCLEIRAGVRRRIFNELERPMPADIFRPTIRCRMSFLTSSPPASCSISTASPKVISALPVNR